MKRITLILAATIGSMLAFPLVARADQAILAHDALFEMGPGEVVEYDDVLVLSHFGIPTVVFDGATGFADDETVIATIALSTKAIDGLGSVQLLGSPTISGTTPADWTTGASDFTFQPAIALRYTAPSAAELDCDDHHSERFTTHLGVSATLVGSAGTTASFSADDFPSSVLFRITCPPWAPAPAAPTPEAPAPAAPTVTPPPTSTPPAPVATGSLAAWPDQLLFLVVAAAVGALVILVRPSTTRRERP